MRLEIEFLPFSGERFDTGAETIKRFAADLFILCEFFISSCWTGLKFSEISFIILLGSISSARFWFEYAGVELTSFI